MKLLFKRSILMPCVLCIFFSNNMAQEANRDTLPDSLLLQESDTLQNIAPKVFIDCDFCDLDYIRKEVPFVNYVRDRMGAQVHVLVTAQQTGSGGREFTVLFIGLKEFSGMNDTLVFVTSPVETADEIRKVGAHILKLGLIRYLAQTPLGQQVTIDVFHYAADLTTVEDKWKNWVFEINLGAWFNGEQLTSTINLRPSIFVSKITPEWKIELKPRANYSKSKFQTDDTTIYSILHDENFNTLVVKSLGEHWSVGGFARVRSTIYENIKLDYRIAPAVEYNYFPYSESTRKQLRFLYKLGYTYYYYNDTTIFNKIEEGLFHENLGVAFEIKDKWGSINISLNGFHYFHDPSLNSLWFYSNLNLRIFKGFSLRISGGYSFIHDQISLKKEEATADQIKLGLTQLPTEFRYWGNVGINYTFGSIYNNVVNPRFGN
ncbi:MAG: hypothetical protein FVQ77_05760 [Cytophagales bacterium]|nr:hypothetical protein [Cytophagales bacterium]